ncbi:transposase family protein [Streptomyces sp. NPDC088788]|uniref:transposase family protein n=1 Tax=Streptomyces sp. NPDC088788 TaxID=3365898 RepID=UPI003809F0F6
MPAPLYEVDRSTITRAAGEIRRLLTERGSAVPGRHGVRLRTLEEVFAHAQAEGVPPRLHATEIQVRRPTAGQGGRKAFVSGTKKQNTMKATVIAHHRGRILWTDRLPPGRIHDVTAARTAGIGPSFDHSAQVDDLPDDGYLGPSRDHSGKALTPLRTLRAGTIALSSNAGNASDTTTYRSGSPSSTPSPTTNTGNNCSAGPTTATSSPTPTEQSPAWYPTAPPPTDQHREQGKHTSPATTHQLDCERLIFAYLFYYRNQTLTEDLDGGAHTPLRLSSTASRHARLLHLHRPLPAIMTLSDAAFPAQVRSVRGAGASDPGHFYLHRAERRADGRVRSDEHRSSLADLALRSDQPTAGTVPICAACTPSSPVLAWQESIALLSMKPDPDKPS